MMSWIRSKSLCIVALALSAVGCAPSAFRDGVPYVTAKHQLTDAHYQKVEGFPCLRVDNAMLQELDAVYAADADVESARKSAVSFMNQAHAAALHSTRGELDRSTEKVWHEIGGRYFGENGTHISREEIWKRFEAETDAQVARVKAELAAAESVMEVRSVMRPIHDGVKPSIKTAGRVLRAAPWALFSVPSALIVKSIHDGEYRGPQDAPFASAVRYVPNEATADVEIRDPNWPLLQRFAPVLVQEETPANAPYKKEVDTIGRIVATTVDVIDVDTTQPTVYAYSRNITLQGRPLTQLVYTQWYPQHPKLKSFDPEHGKLEGTTLRITLDANNEPLCFETVYNCGCYHRLYPTARLESAAAAEFGAPEKEKTLAVEKNVSARIDLIVPKVVEWTHPTRPVIRARAGWHGLVDVANAEGKHGPEVAQTQKYTLLPYDELEHLHTPDGRVTSMFGADGLVKGAKRLEGIFFRPLGMLAAGQPRQRGTQLIHWDQYDFDDPNLFAKTLRLPNMPVNEPPVAHAESPDAR